MARLPILVLSAYSVGKGAGMVVMGAGQGVGHVLGGGKFGSARFHDGLVLVGDSHTNSFCLLISFWRVNLVCAWHR
jgi:hypothetical protein